MIKLINRNTGTEMWVAEDRLDHYLALGHFKADDVLKNTRKSSRDVEIDVPAAEKPRRRGRK